MYTTAFHYTSFFSSFLMGISAIVCIVAFVFFIASLLTGGKKYPIGTFVIISICVLLMAGIQSYWDEMTSTAVKHTATRVGGVEEFKEKTGKIVQEGIFAYYSLDENPSVIVPIKIISGTPIYDKIVLYQTDGK